MTDLQLGKPFKYHRKNTIGRIVNVTDVYRITDIQGAGLQVEWRRQIAIQDLAAMWEFSVPVIGRAQLPTGLILPVPTTLQVDSYRPQPDRLCRLERMPAARVSTEDGRLLELELQPTSPEPSP